MTAAFSIGAVLGLPLVPYINDRYGRKACIVLGSGIITVGAILQTASVNSNDLLALAERSLVLTIIPSSCDVFSRSNHPRHGHRVCH